MVITMATTRALAPITVRAMCHPSRRGSVQTTQRRRDNIQSVTKEYTRVKGWIVEGILMVFCWVVFQLQDLLVFALRTVTSSCACTAR